MASSATDRIPPFFILAPVAGIAAWLLIGKVGLGLLAIPVLAALLCNVTAAVHHAEVVALRVGEPFGGLILALSVTVIEAGLIISLMLTGDENPALMRDTLLATVMFVLHGIAGLAILVGGIVHRENQFRVAGGECDARGADAHGSAGADCAQSRGIGARALLQQWPIGFCITGLPRALRCLPVHSDQSAP